MDLLLVRHSAVAVPQGVCYGRRDVALAADFPRIASALRDRMPADLARVVSSPASRCRRLAAVLAGALPVELDGRLREMDFGRWEGCAWETLPSAEQREWSADWLRRAPPEGESLERLAQRVQPVLTAWHAGPAPLLVVAHGGPLRILMATCFGLTLREAMGLPLPRASLHHLRRQGGHWRLHERWLPPPVSGAADPEHRRFRCCSGR